MSKSRKNAPQLRKRQRRQLVFRVNFLFFAVFLMFSVLILRLGYLQIVTGDEYVRELARKEEISVNTTMPRGKIYDRYGHVLVDNQPQNAITYTKASDTPVRTKVIQKGPDKGKKTGPEGILDIAEKLAGYIEKDDKRVTIGDKRDFWILLNPEAAAEKVSEEERKALLSDDTLTSKEKDREINRLTRERVTEQEINGFTEEELKVLAIYREMMSGYAYSPQIVKNEEVTEEEFALVSERLAELPGVNTTTDWERVKLSKSNILGSTTSPVEGIPKSHLDYYLSRGYSRNERVGRSYLEQQYEELLAGQKSVFKTVKNRSGQVIDTEVVHVGEPGKDIILSTDRELEMELEKHVENKLLELKKMGTSGALDEAFIVMMDPNNGEVLSLVGKKLVKNEETGQWEAQDYAYGTFTSSTEMGSTVKMATLLTGYSENVVRVNETKIDEPINVGGTIKRSLFNRFGRVAVNDIQAIGRSSNVYMFRIAFSLGKGNYVPGRPMAIDKNAFNVFRQSFGAFGLGTPTGIDLPGEASGLVGRDTLTGKLMDFSIGQFDTYTTLQMAQYISTIANDGYRIAPRMVKEIREPSPDGETFGPLIQETQINILNRIPNTAEEIAQVKKGLDYVYNGPNGTARNLLNGASYTAAGKTGTAQTFKDGKMTISLSHVGYAPAEKPEVAFAVVVPHASTSQSSYPPAASDLVRSSLDSYFAIKEKRLAEQAATDVQNKIQKPLEVDELEKEDEQ